MQIKRRESGKRENPYIQDKEEARGKACIAARKQEEGLGQWEAAVQGVLLRCFMMWIIE